MPRKVLMIGWLIVFFLCGFSTFAQNTQKRVALVLGNSSYKSPNNLNNADNDAVDMANALAELGFDVVRGINQNKQQTENLITLFEEKLSEGKSVGLFYYSGIGVQSNGENFLVPIDASFLNYDETLKTSVSLNSVISKMKAAKNEINLLLLDAKQKNPYGTIWQNNDIDFGKIGFAKIYPPTDTLVFYSSEPGRTALERCGRNGYFAASFLKQLEKPSLDFGQLAKNVSDEIREKTDKQQQPTIDGLLTKYFYFVDEQHKFDTNERNSLASLFESFKSESKCPCGQRDEALTFGKQIIEKYGDDELNKDVIAYINKKNQQIEKEDPICRRNDRYNNSYKARNWYEFFAVSKEIIEQDNNQGLVLDVMLTLVSVGYNLSAVNKYDSLNTDTMIYAEKAIQQIESGTKSSNGQYGAFEPFMTKDNALSWVNFIIGWQMYDKMSRKKEALAYLYKSTQIGNEKKNDIDIYVKIGTYYYDEALRLDAEYRTKRTANKNEDNDETKALLALARGTADRATDAFGRAYKIAVNSKLKTDAIDAIKKTLDDLYRFRFNIPPDVKLEGVEIYVEKLISRPMPDPATKVEPVLQ